MGSASLLEIKRSIKSVQSTMQITKAMELVATSKLRRAKERAEQTRPYHKALSEAISRIRSYEATAETAFAEERKAPKTCFIVVAGDRGLAGGFNNNIFRLTASLAARCEGPCCYLPIGKKAIERFAYEKKEILTDSFVNVSSFGVSKSLALGHALSDYFLEGKIDRAVIVYTEFVSMLSQVPTYSVLLPLSPFENDPGENDSGEPDPGEQKKTPSDEPIYESPPEEMLKRIVPDYLGGTIYIALCESFAAECGARRTAMSSANKNAEEMLSNLSLSYNRARQAVITQEITEIVSGADAL
ncbi:MAG: ATP synthase F1 subunit gamma [Clostridia bacterium]|nr:ATP synthase F1 subunit gamma [Clostridia bacterium]